MADRRAVRALAELGAGDLALAGGKGANLGELVRAGFPVPPGFVVTTEGELGTRGEPLARDLADAVARAYRELGAPAVAVRSSGTAEDLPEASFAGQHETLLDVRGEQAVLDAVAHCAASLWTERARRYRAERGVDEAGVRMAVVVQAMAPHEVAGVVFTVHPLAAEPDRMLINAVRGSGEALVSGEAVPDQWVARRPDGAVLEHVPAQRPVASPFGPPARARPPLPSDRVRELALLALRVEDHFGAPQDVEWSYGGGEFFLLQARPITGPPPSSR